MELRFGFLNRKHAIGQTQGQGGSRIHGAPGQEQVLRAGTAAPGEHHRSHRGEDPELDLGLAELGALVGEHPIAEGGQLQAAPQAPAVHQGQERHVGLDQIAEEPVEFREQGRDLLGSVLLDAGAVRRSLFRLL